MSKHTGSVSGRSERTTQQQIQHYIQFCKKHPEITRYQLERHDKTAPNNVQKLWVQLVDELNEMRGPTRTVKKWKDTLTHWRNQVRCRSRKYKAENGSNIVTSHYEDLLKFVDSLPPPENAECPSSEEQPSVVNDSLDETNFPFDSIFLPCDGLLENSSTSSRSPTPVSDISDDAANHPTLKKFKVNKSAKVHGHRPNFGSICATLVKSLETRREKEDVLFIRQQSVITKLDQTLTTMNQVLEKINDKLDGM